MSSDDSDAVAAASARPKKRMRSLKSKAAVAKEARSAKSKGGGKLRRKRDTADAGAKRPQRKRARAGSLETPAAATETMAGATEKLAMREDADAYASEEDVERTKADDDFLDIEDEDDEFVKEVKTEIKFDDSEGRAALKAKRDKELQRLNAIAKVTKVAKTKGGRRKLTDAQILQRDRLREDAVWELLSKMKDAAIKDAQAVRARKPALRKLALLPKVVEMLRKTQLHDLLLGPEDPGEVRYRERPAPGAEGGPSAPGDDLGSSDGSDDSDDDADDAAAAAAAAAAEAAAAAAAAAAAEAAAAEAEAATSDPAPAPQESAESFETDLRRRVRIIVGTTNTDALSLKVLRTMVEEQMGQSLKEQKELFKGVVTEEMTRASGMDAAAVAADVEKAQAEVKAAEEQRAVREAQAAAEAAAAAAADATAAAADVAEAAADSAEAEAGSADNAGAATGNVEGSDSGAGVQDAAGEASAGAEQSAEPAANEAGGGDVPTPSADAPANDASASGASPDDGKDDGGDGGDEGGDDGNGNSGDGDGDDGDDADDGDDGGDDDDTNKAGNDGTEPAEAKMTAVKRKHPSQLPMEEYHILQAFEHWLLPQKRGQLPTLKLRTEIYRMLMTLPITTGHLKQTTIGRVLLAFLKSKAETPGNKKQLKILLEKWKRLVYRKDDDLGAHFKELQDRGVGRRARAEPVTQHFEPAPALPTSLADAISSRGAGQAGPRRERASIPVAISADFVRAPEARVEAVREAVRAKSNRASVARRIVQLRRPTQKNVRAAKVSLEGKSVSYLGK